MSAVAGLRVLQATHRDGLRIEHLEQGILRLVLDRPERRNAMDPALMTALVAVLESERDARLVLVEGEGGVFCAGADLENMRRQAHATHAENRADAALLSRLFFGLASHPAPTLARVQGAAIGGGLGLVACCDEVLAEAGTAFATSEVRLGIVPGVISPYVVRRLGVGLAAPLLLTGRRIQAAEAHRIGLVHHVAEGPEAAQSQWAALVQAHLQAGPQAARRTKALLLAAAPLPAPAQREATCDAITEARATDEAREGLQAFFDKRPPAWIPEELP